MAFVLGVLNSLTLQYRWHKTGVTLVSLLTLVISTLIKK